MSRMMIGDTMNTRQLDSRVRYSTDCQFTLSGPAFRAAR